MTLQCSSEFKGVIIQIVCCRNSVRVCMGLNQYNLRNNLPSLIGPKFHTSKQSDSEEEEYSIFSYSFLWFKPMTPNEEPFWTVEALFEQTMFRTNFKQPGQKDF